MEEEEERGRTGGDFQRLFSDSALVRKRIGIDPDDSREVLPQPKLIPSG
jgi:hypothetical protein